MFWEVQSIQAFHSIVPGSLMEFYDSIGVQRDVASRPDTTHYGLRGLTSVKYLFDDDHDTEYFAGEDYADPAMPGWMYYGNTNGFDIWENEHYIPMASPTTATSPKRTTKTQAKLPRAFDAQGHRPHR